MTTPAEKNKGSFLTGVLDRLVEQRCGGPVAPTLKPARAQFEALRGQVRQDEPLWEAWTRAFLEWYVLERPESSGPCAARIAAGAAADPRQRQALLSLASSQRILGEVIGLSAGRVHLIDLLGGARFDVTERRTLHGVSRGDVVEVRVIGFEDDVHFGRLFVHHPSGTRPLILRHVQKLKAAGIPATRICDVLAERRLRCDRYLHVTPLRIYAEPIKMQIEPAGPGEGTPGRPAVHADLDV